MPPIGRCSIKECAGENDKSSLRYSKRKKDYRRNCPDLFQARNTGYSDD